MGWYLPLGRAAVVLDMVKPKVEVEGAPERHLLHQPMARVAGTPCARGATARAAAEAAAAVESCVSLAQVYPGAVVVGPTDETHPAVAGAAHAVARLEFGADTPHQIV